MNVKYLLGLRTSTRLSTVEYVVRRFVSTLHKSSFPDSPHPPAVTSEKLGLWGRD